LIRPKWLRHFGGDHPVLAFPRIFRLPPIQFRVFGDQTLLLSSATAPVGDFRPF
jgi:hypothetical protein